MVDMFYNYENLNNINLTTFNTNKVTDISLMFEGVKD